MKRCIASPRKARYRSEQEAVRAAVRIQTTSGHVLDAYRCSGCGGWHLANPPA